MKNSKYGWVICFSCTLLLFCTGGLATTGFSAYQPYLIHIGGLTNTQSSTIILFRNLFSLIGMLCTSRLIARFEVKRVIGVAMLICAASFFTYGLASSFPAYCLASALAGCSLGTGGMIPASLLISRWFNKHRGLAIGICMSATGLSSLIAAPLITYMAEHLSMRTAFFVEATFILIAAAVVYNLTRSNPSCIQAQPIGSQMVDATMVYAAHNASKGLYFSMMLGIFLFGIPGNTLYSHISVLYRTNGFSSAQISTLLSIFGVALAAGKCTYGLIADKIGTYRASWILYSLCLGGNALNCLAGNGNYVTACIAVSVMGFGLAVTAVSISMYAARISTQEAYPRTLTRFQMLSTGGTILFGTVPGMIADRTGSYVPAFALMFLFGVTAALLLQISYLLIRNSDKAYANTHKLLRSQNCNPPIISLSQKGKARC